MFIKFPVPFLNSDGGGGGGSPVASPFTGGGQGRARQGQQEGGGGDVDTQALLREMAQEIHQANLRAAQADQRSDGLENVLGGMREALGVEGRQEKEADWYEDELLPHLLELEKQGKSHPMTAKLAMQLRSTQMTLGEAKQLIAAMKQELADLKNPSLQNEQRAYSQMDDFITEELTSVYGEAKAPLHRAVAANIATDLARIQKEFPHKWEEIRRDERKIRNIVRHHIEAIVPPRARQVMAEKIEADTPITLSTLNEAWQQFNQIKQNLTPYQREEISRHLRQQILSQQFAQNRRIPRR